MTRVLLIALAALVLGLLAALWRIDTVTTQRDTARKEATDTKGELEKSEQNRTTEQARQGVADTEGAKGHEDQERSRTDGAVADDAGKRLRAEASRLATQLATCNATVAGERTARAAAADLLADVLSRADERAGDLAKIADRARAAGLTCERTYDGVRALQ